MKRITPLLLPLCLQALPALAADPFPGTPVGEIGGALPGTFEPSGAVWHADRGTLLVVSDAGELTELTADGALVQTWSIPGDLEGVCVADPLGGLVYLGREHPDAVIEFDLVTGVALRTFDLTATMTGPDNDGLEGLTFVPDPAHPEGGLFYASLQADGRVYVFDLPISSSSTSTAVLHVDTITPVAGRADLSGLHYNPAKAALYAIYDGSDLIREMDAAGVFVGEWQLPGNDQEGVAVNGCELFIAEDVGPEVWRYTGWDGDPADSDGDGVSDCLDQCPGTAPGAAVEADGCACGDGPAVAVCGNGVCEAADGEDCLTCAADCNGKQGGKPSGRWCCGDPSGAGVNYLACSAPACNDGGVTCSTAPPAGGSCCGDGVCDLGESGCSCAADCGGPPSFELACDDGVDDDCDGLQDCDDPDCAADPACAPPACDGDGVCEPGEDCNSCGQDCPGVTKGPPSGRYCCGDGVPQGPETGGLCGGNP